MSNPAWIDTVLDANEGLALDSSEDKAKLAQVLEHFVRGERQQLLRQIATWLRQRDHGLEDTPTQLAHMIERGNWT